MKIPQFIGLVLVILVLSVTVLIGLDKTVPHEFLIAFGGLVTYMLGLTSDNPFNKEDK